MRAKKLTKILICFILALSQLQAQGENKEKIYEIMRKSAREKSKKILTKAEAIEDLKYLNNQLRIHPAIYRVRSKEETKKEYEKILEEL
ncbi:MAG: hypothetical protein ACQERZ_08405, partial [Fusobacteriota bacterium]